MSWEHELAKEIKARDNPNLPMYLVGTVVSGSPLRVSIYDGKVTLTGNQVKRVDPWVKCTARDNGCTPKLDSSPCTGCVKNGTAGACLEPIPLEAGQKVVLVGDQTYVVLGVVR